MLPSARAGSASAPATSSTRWQSLGTPREELTLDFTLPTGQSFRWRKSGAEEYTGVIGQRLVRLRQEQDDVLWTVIARGPQADVAGDAAALREYFNLDESFAERCKDWAAKDPRFKLIHPYFPGARMLRQDPLECLFQFVCSSNNHISRIHGMIERLCFLCGSPLAPAQPLPDSAPTESGTGNNKWAFFAFPTLEQLAAVTEDELRIAGFGYRARFVVGSVAALREKPGGGCAWLEALRHVSYREAADALITLPGVGPKVAACVCLFSLDKHEAIPVDTHVWQLASRYYTPNLRGKTLTPKLMTAVEDAFIARFGPYAGWAHNVLFISDLASSRQFLPPKLHPRGVTAAVKEESGSGEPATPALVEAEPSIEEHRHEKPAPEAVVRVKRERTAAGTERVSVTAVARPRRQRKG